jgi:hypothetical protein
MITDTSANIRHIAEVIQKLDVEGSREKVRLYPLTHASAQVMSEQILRILDKTKAALPGLEPAPGPAQPAMATARGCCPTTGSIP